MDRSTPWNEQKSSLIPQWKEQKSLLIPHLSSATGDTIHVAAALVLYERLHVIVIHCGEVGTCKDLLNFYYGVTERDERVKVVYTMDMYTALEINRDLINNKGELLALKKRPEPPHQFKDIQAFYHLYFEPLETNTNIYQKQYTLVGSLDQATEAVANKFTARGLKQIYTDLAKGLSQRNLRAEEIIQVMDGPLIFRSKNVTLPRPNDGPVALLWARYSGTNSLTGYNPGGDSSVQGQSQLLTLLKELRFKVITIGHGPRGGNSITSQFDVGEFYIQTPAGAGQAPIVRDRAWQTSFFLALMQTYPGRLFQIGQKTGGMDCAALLGVPTLYLEDKESHSYKRMLNWVGKVPFYRNYEIAFPPSRIGASLRTTFREDPPVPELYSFDKRGPDLEQLASPKTRIACMIHKYPDEMGQKKEMIVQDVVKWVNKIKAEDLEEVIREANLSTKSDKSVGYTKKDLDEIKEAMRQLRVGYGVKTAVIRKADGVYETRGIPLKL